MFRCGVFGVGELLQTPRASRSSKLFTLKCALNCWQRCNFSLLLALGMTVYILIAIRFEERDLLAVFGHAYADYRRRVGMLVPGLGRGR